MASEGANWSEGVFFFGLHLLQRELLNSIKIGGSEV
jgi:hypothetical protein